MHGGSSKSMAVDLKVGDQIFEFKSPSSAMLDCWDLKFGHGAARGNATSYDFKLDYSALSGFSPTYNDWSASKYLASYCADFNFGHGAGRGYVISDYYVLDYPAHSNFSYTYNDWTTSEVLESYNRYIAERRKALSAQKYQISKFAELLSRLYDENLGRMGQSGNAILLRPEVAQLLPSWFLGEKASDFSSTATVFDVSSDFLRAELIPDLVRVLVTYADAHQCEIRELDRTSTRIQRVIRQLIATGWTEAKSQGVATRERKFFLKHGAHPPKSSGQRVASRFSDWVFTPPNAAN